MARSKKKRFLCGCRFGRLCAIISLLIVVIIGVLITSNAGLPDSGSRLQAVSVAARNALSSAHQSSLGSRDDVDDGIERSISKESASSMDTRSMELAQLAAENALHLAHEITLRSNHTGGGSNHSGDARVRSSVSEASTSTMKTRHSELSQLRGMADGQGRHTNVSISNQTAEGRQLLQSLLLSPDTKPYKFYGYRAKGPPSYHGYAGQSGQDRWVDLFLGQRNGLFVVESGAYDGEESSNSLFFETRRRWKCLLVEANPVLQQSIKGKHRKCHLLKGGLSATGQVGSFKFKVAGGLGGLVDHLSKDKGFSDRVNAHVTGKRDASRSGLEVDVHCFPLASVLEEIGQTVVDYWSLDTEGSELEILRHTDFRRVEVGLISVEHNRHPETRAKIKTLLWRSGFWRVVEIEQDDVYANPCYFVKRRLHFPFPGSPWPESSDTWKAPEPLAIDLEHLKRLGSNLEQPSKRGDQDGIDPSTSVQDAWVDQIMGKRTHLFLMEYGTREMTLSSTWFSAARNWDCLIILGSGSKAKEPAKFRHCWNLKGSFSLSKTAASGMYPIHLILRGMNRDVIDLLSLDAGSQTLKIITQNLDLSQTEVGMLSVRVDTATGDLHRRVRFFMEQHGFKHVKSFKTIDFYANPCYFMKNNLTFPSVSPF